MRIPRLPALALAVVVALLGAFALGAFDGGGPSIRAEPVTTTSEPTTSTSTEPTTSTTALPVIDGQVVRYRGLELRVPIGWAVHDLDANPRTCLRVDVHAVYLGTPGPDQDCPAHLVGHTEAVVLQPIETASDMLVARATTPGVLNGMTIRTDPAPGASGTLTVVFPDLGVVAFVTYGATRTAADQIVAGFVPATS
jgi:hypothetical protein